MARGNVRAWPCDGYTLLGSENCHMFEFQAAPDIDPAPIPLGDGSILRPGDRVTYFGGRRTSAGFTHLDLARGHLEFLGLRQENDLDRCAVLFRWSECPDPLLLYGAFLVPGSPTQFVYTTQHVSSRIIETTTVRRAAALEAALWVSVPEVPTEAQFYAGAAALDLPGIHGRHRVAPVLTGPNRPGFLVAYVAMIEAAPPPPAGIAPLPGRRWVPADLATVQWTAAVRSYRAVKRYMEKMLMDADNRQDHTDMYEAMNRAAVQDDAPSAEAADFLAHKHPVMAVSCPDCGAAVGAWCKRPSGHSGRFVDFHAARKRAADAAWQRQGSRTIYRSGSAWSYEAPAPADFLAYNHPTLAVPCPCGAGIGDGCRDTWATHAFWFHQDRTIAALQEWVRQGSRIIYRRRTGWSYDPPERFAPGEAAEAQRRGAQGVQWEPCEIAAVTGASCTVRFRDGAELPRPAAAVRRPGHADRPDPIVTAPYCAVSGRHLHALGTALADHPALGDPEIVLGVADSHQRVTLALERSATDRYKLIGFVTAKHGLHSSGSCMPVTELEAFIGRWIASAQAAVFP